MGRGGATVAGKASVTVANSVGHLDVTSAPYKVKVPAFGRLPMRQAYHVVIGSLTALSLSYRGGKLSGERRGGLFERTCGSTACGRHISRPDVVGCSATTEGIRNRHAGHVGTGTEDGRQVEESIRSCRATNHKPSTSARLWCGLVDLVTISGPPKPTSPQAHEPTSPRAHFLRRSTFSGHRYCFIPFPHGSGCS